LKLRTAILYAALSFEALIAVPIVAQVAPPAVDVARPTADAILARTDESETREKFQAAIQKALAESPAVLERVAGGMEAVAVRKEAKSAQFPTVDLSLSSNRSIARDFSNDPDNVIERARGAGRVDASASVQQVLYDFGGTQRRIEASKARVEGAAAAVDEAEERIALRAIGAWYEAVAYDYLVRLTEAHLAENQTRRIGLRARIRSGVSARADEARLDSALAVFEQRLAQYTQQKERADASFREIFGPDVSLPVLRAPIGQIPLQGREYFAQRAEKSALVRNARAAARGAYADAKAAKAATLPSVSVGLDAGRFGLFEPGRTDYDIRARVTLRHRMFGPEKARAEQAAARALAAEARERSTVGEAKREAENAWAAVTGLQKELDARLTDYVSTRVTRDAEVARFRFSRGSLFEVLNADDRYFDAAVGYILALSEHDTSRYVLLARSGDLLETLGIDLATENRFRIENKFK
jgi:outer membrane protein, adhesin transport system